MERSNFSLFAVTTAVMAMGHAAHAETITLDEQVLDGPAIVLEPPEKRGPGPLSLPLISTSVVLPSGASGSAGTLVSAQQGLMTISEFASTDGVGMSADSTATWSDEFVINAPGMTGQNGSFSGDFRVTGSAQLIAPPAGDSGSWAGVDSIVSGAIGMNGQTKPLSGYSYHETYGNTSSNAGFDVQFQDVPFVFGSDIGLYISALQYAFSNGTDVANGSFIGSWGGISSVKGPSGMLVGNYTALSTTTGFDFAQAVPLPVPEAAAWQMMGLGLAGLAWVARLRRRGMQS